MSLDQEPALYDARHALHYAIPKGVTTFSACSVEGCTKSARGGRLCASHAEAQLAAIIGVEPANEYAVALRRLRTLENEQIEIIRNSL